jgi:hypothetical protein
MVGLGYVVGRFGVNMLRKKFFNAAASIGLCSLFGGVGGAICGTVAGIGSLGLTAYDLYYIYDQLSNQGNSFREFFFDISAQRLRRLANERILSSTSLEKELAIRCARNSIAIPDPKDKNNLIGSRQFLSGDSGERYRKFKTMGWGPNGKYPIMWAPKGDINHCGANFIGRPGTEFGDRKVETQTNAEMWGFDDEELNKISRDLEREKGIKTLNVNQIVWPKIMRYNSECVTGNVFLSRIAEEYGAIMRAWLQEGAPQGGIASMKKTEDAIYDKAYEKWIGPENGCVTTETFMYLGTEQAKNNLEYVVDSLKNIKNPKTGVPFLRSNEDSSQCNVKIVKAIIAFQAAFPQDWIYYYKGKRAKPNGIAEKNVILAMARKRGHSSSVLQKRGVKFN